MYFQSLKINLPDYVYVNLVICKDNVVEIDSFCVYGIRRKRQKNIEYN